eukprot:11215393-Lingulodinium_polyedra.AAC.1
MAAAARQDTATVVVAVVHNEAQASQSAALGRAVEAERDRLAGEASGCRNWLLPRSNTSRASPPRIPA